MMAETMYRRPDGYNPTLEDIMQAVASGAPGTPSPAVPGPQDQMDPQQSELLRMLMTPESQGPAPVVEEKPWWAKMLMGMGDAYSAYGATLAGGSPGESSFSKYLRSKERSKADLTEWQRKTSESKRDADLRGATFLYGAKQRKDERVLADAAAATARKEAQDLRREALAQQKTIADEAAARDAAQFEKQKAWERERLTIQNAHDSAQDRLHERIRNGDKVAMQDESKVESAKAYVATLADNIDSILQTTTPDVVLTRARRFFDQKGMSKDARAIVDAYLAQEVGPTITELTNKALDAGSPQQLPSNADMTPSGMADYRASRPGVLVNKVASAIDAIGNASKKPITFGGGF